MSLIGAEGLDVAFLPIGDTFTMGVEDSIKAVQLLNPSYVVPMHYNTFPPIQQNVGEWADMIQRETQAQPIVLEPDGVFVLGDV
jgi:L-ascorbate metabolism protein UlaG (beta-lactamase superfamily)